MIFNADLLYILIDGDLFCQGKFEEKIRSVQMNYSLFINPYISNYSIKNYGRLPTTFFVITKCQRVLRRNRIVDIHKILKLAFSNVFDSENIGYIEPYTICIDTKKNISVKIPFLTGIYYYMNQTGSSCDSIKKLLEKELREYQRFMITDFQKGELPIKIKKPNLFTVRLPIRIPNLKADKIPAKTSADISQEKIIEILSEAFSNVICEKQRTYIVCFSLGTHIEENGFKGAFEPVNAQIPFFIGVYHEFKNYCSKLKTDIKKADDASRRAIADKLSDIKIRPLAKIKWMCYN